MNDLRIRQRIEEAEENLSIHASKSLNSKGRIKQEESCPLRTEFQRDRDRIIHSKAFRRLKHKTQVFIAPPGDHYVTRLTHTLEVSQIARTLARALNLNEDLTEAIALGHDLGHTPFGHVGEEVLNEIYPDGFRHNEQSLRVVDLLEKCAQGLNLTWEVRDGILNHSKSNVDVFGDSWTEAGTLEGQVVKVSDLVAYINHDIGDSIRAGIITENDLPQQVKRDLGDSSSQRINTLVLDIVNHTNATINSDSPDKPVISMSPKIVKASNILREFLFSRVYNSNLASKDKEQAKEIVRTLYSYFINNEDKLPEEYSYRQESTERKVTDYIAGMTDYYALHVIEEIHQEIKQ
jgi:dGTPase